MANNKLLVNERQRDLGNFMVGRLLPFRKKRQVGPFTFIDHMGPTKLNKDRYMDVDQHPHIGLSTLTYLFEGEIEHKDSMGHTQIISPGDVGFMTSGHGEGVTHTERTPAHLRNGQEMTMHGYQIWVALPEADKTVEARFDYFPSDDLPEWEANDIQFRLLAGEAFGRTAPLQGYSPMFMVDLRVQADTTLSLKGQLKGEVALVIVKGKICDEGETIEAGQMLISKTNESCEIKLERGTVLLIFGGEPLPSEPLLLWNFVAYDKEGLNTAAQRWRDKQFPQVPGDGSYIPMPEMKR